MNNAAINQSPSTTDRSSILLGAFNNTSDDLLANRAGKLSPPQIQRIQRSEYSFIAGAFIITLLFGWFIYSVAQKPFNTAQIVLGFVIALVILGLEASMLRRTYSTVLAARVECLTGAVQLRVARRACYVQLSNQEFVLPILQFKHLRNGASYRVYFAPNNRRIIAIEPV